MRKEDIYAAINDKFGDRSNEFEIFESSSGSFETFFFRSKAVFRIFENNKGESVQLLIEEGINRINKYKLSNTMLPKSDRFYFFLSDGTDCGFDLDLFLDYINYSFEGIISSISAASFGCCGLFTNCSNERKCLKENDPQYKGCLYRKNLEENRIFYGINKNYPASTFKVLSFDTEYINSYQNICQIGLYMEDISTGTTLYEKSILVNPGDVYYHDHSISVHNLDIESIKNASYFDAVYTELKEVFEAADLVLCHNKGADCSALYKECDRYHLGYPEFKFIDTVALSSTILQRESNLTLKKLSTDLGLPAYMSHDALADAKTTLLLFRKLQTIDKAAVEKSIKRAESFQRYCKKHGKLYNNGDIEDVHILTYEEAKTKLQNFPLYGTIYLVGCFNDTKQSIADALNKKGFRNVETDKAISRRYSLCVLGDYGINEKDIANIEYYDDFCISATDFFAIVENCPCLFIDDGVPQENNTKTLSSAVNTKKRIMPERESLQSAGIEFTSFQDAINIAKDLGSLIVVLTGDFSYGKREEVVAKLIARGITVKSSVSKETSFVIVGNIADKTSSKIKKAIKLNIPIITEDTLFEIIFSINTDSVYGDE